MIRLPKALAVLSVALALPALGAEPKGPPPPSPEPPAPPCARAFWIQRFFSATVPVSTKNTRYAPAPSMTTSPRVPPSIVRSCVIGGSAAASVIVADPEGREKRIASPAAACSSAKRRVPATGAVASSELSVTTHALPLLPEIVAEKLAEAPLVLRATSVAVAVTV